MGQIIRHDRYRHADDVAEPADQVRAARDEASCEGREQRFHRRFRQGRNKGGNEWWQAFRRGVCLHPDLTFCERSLDRYGPSPT
ncbi:hypothetical protein LAB1_51960 [Roseibium sp. LAB1]